MRVRSSIGEAENPTVTKYKKMLEAMHSENKLLKAKLAIAEDLCRGEGGDLHKRFRSRTSNKHFIKKHLKG
jgi:hypothetical protein